MFQIWGLASIPHAQDPPKKKLNSGAYRASALRRISLSWQESCYLAGDGPTLKPKRTWLTCDLHSVEGHIDSLSLGAVGFFDQRRVAKS